MRSFPDVDATHFLKSGSIVLDDDIGDSVQSQDGNIGVGVVGGDVVRNPAGLEKIAGNGKSGQALLAEYVENDGASSCAVDDPQLLLAEPHMKGVGVGGQCPDELQIADSKNEDSGVGTVGHVDLSG